jgi:hypothetical protein
MTGVTFPSLNEFPQGRQVFLARRHGECEQPMADEACQHLPLDEETHRPDKAAPLETALCYWVSWPARGDRTLAA